MHIPYYSATQCVSYKIVTIVVKKQTENDNDRHCISPCIASHYVVARNGTLEEPGIGGGGRGLEYAREWTGGLSLDKAKVDTWS